MGDDPTVEGRGSVRIAMQWDDQANCGFTSARPRVPVVEEGAFGCRQVSVGGQREDPRSLLNWMERLVRTRKETPELGWGSARVVPAGDPAVLVASSARIGTELGWTPHKPDVEEMIHDAWRWLQKSSG